jgi:cation-transporting ATPase E
VDARTLPADIEAMAAVVADHTVFGRVTPEQKRDLVTALHLRDHTVAMTGDGVNDVLALKHADIGVAMGAGSPAARSVAQLVLLDNRFATLPHVVAEGRRVIANIERVANLFLTKTVYSVCMAVVIGVAGVPYPFLPRHSTLLNSVTIGVPAFFLALAPNAERARGGFVRRVMRLAVPSGVIAGAATVTTYLVVTGGRGSFDPAHRTAAVITLYLVATWVLVLVARPLAPWKLALIGAMVAAFLLALLTPHGRALFALDPSRPADLAVALAVSAVAAVAISLARWVDGRLARR